jgi:nitroreductase
MTAAATLGRLVDQMPPPQSACEFSERPLDDDVLAALLGAARVAPSADNLQTWRFVVVRDRERRRQLGDLLEGAMAEMAARAPVVIVACGVRGMISQARREQPFVLIDVPIALTHLLLEATELDLACAWTLDLPEADIAEVLKLPPPSAVKPIALVALGHRR